MVKNTKNTMQYSNGKIKEKLVNLGYLNIHLFPHSRFSKDYHIEGCDFDAFGWREGEKTISFFQFKTNKKPSKEILQKYKYLEKKLNIKCLWVEYRKKEGVFFYNKNSINNKKTRIIPIEV
ncbi:MAG: hypothetical protein ACOC3Z_03185 [Nanoarchaeota archaeon]